uniref:procollagen-proline 4-dioxygenase n=1 Tax=Tetraselmis sp. GSL018 TaxID=582737 RepID=A0A061R8P5_9CHLO|mmetsp:Transcript_29234/g.69776  ORF Transcript_29234/g.69776 Transcript_29234/m.69776 type:complete len:342 (+) Transcript_29234:144-1169(+)
MNNPEGKAAGKAPSGARRHKLLRRLLPYLGFFILGRYLDLFLDLAKLPNPSNSHTSIVEVSKVEESDNASSTYYHDEDITRKMEVLGFSHRRVQQSDIDHIGSRILLSDVPALHPTESGSPDYRTIPFQVLSWYPRIVLFPNFLDHDKCDHVVEIGKSRLGPSGLVLRQGETEEGTRDIRTSSGTFLSRGQDPKGVLAEVEDRIAAWTSVPAGHGEPFNLLRYEQGQHYDSHYDVFDETYGPQPSQRLATVLVYLSDVEEGGETVFPLEGRGGLERLIGIDYKSCDLGFKYKPRKGDALLFYSLHPNGTIDRHSLHGGCPVVRGEKWVMTKWIRDKCFGSC